jgi:hypothetical protein
VGFRWKQRALLVAASGACGLISPATIQAAWSRRGRNWTISNMRRSRMIDLHDISAL